MEITMLKGDQTELVSLLLKLKFWNPSLSEHINPLLDALEPDAGHRN